VSYYDNLHLLDARVRKDFRIYGNHRAAIGVDIFNLLNKNTVTSANLRSGATYGQVLTAAGNTATLPFLPGRNVQITANYSF
jgi:outer membrane receptor protein involved in Fe transport